MLWFEYKLCVKMLLHIHLVYLQPFVHTVYRKYKSLCCTYIDKICATWTKELNILQHTPKLFIVTSHVISHIHVSLYYTGEEQDYLAFYLEKHINLSVCTIIVS